MNKTELRNAILNGTLTYQTMNPQQRDLFHKMAKEASDWEDSKAQAASAPAPVTAAPAAPSVQPLRSPSEVSRAIQDERYRHDEAYRSDVANRIAAGEAAGYRLF